MVAGRRRSCIWALALLALGAAACADGNGATPLLPTTTRASAHARPPHTGTTKPATQPKPVPVGAAKFGTTAYPIPTTGAYFVSPTGDDNATGSQTAPWQTLEHAVASAPTGSTIVMRAGTYSESVTIDGKRLTIQPFPKEAVIFDGSQVVSTWAPQGSVWRARWTYRFPRQRLDMVSSKYPMANAPDQVFADGVQLEQAGAQSDVGPGSFYVDRSAHALYIGTDPAAHVISASYLPTALTFTNADGSVVRGIKIERYATPLNSYAPLQVLSNGMSIENIVSQDNAAAGITVQGAGVTLNHDTFIDNGQLGVHAYHADGLVIDANLLRHNNTQHFDPSTEAGGVKVSSTTGVTVRSTEADHNLGDGIWFDVFVTGATVVRNVVHHNDDEGIQYEISTNAVIASNIVYDNGGAGIRLTESTGIDVWNNTLVTNQRDIEVLDGNRPQGVQDVRIRNNLFFDGSDTSDVLLAVDDLTHTRTAAEMDVTADSDMFCRSTPSLPPTAVLWAALPTAVKFPSVGSFSQGVGQETHARACDGISPVDMFIKSRMGDYRLLSDSPAKRSGAPLPPSVAAAIGVTAGVAVDVGTLRFG